MRKPLLLALAALAGAAPLAGLPATELFPVEPGVNAERGFAVAVDGDWLAMGAPRDDEKGEDAGAVYLFQWSGTAWEQKAKLFAELPREGAHLGLSLALRDGVLAAGAPGEGAVHLFALAVDDFWAPAQTLAGPPRAFGRSLALDGNRLAVGAVGGHGETDGAAYLYIYRDGSWRLQQKVRPRTPRQGERFGAAVSLAGKVLAVGAPGHGHGPGAVYLFQRDPTRWIEKAKLPAPDSPPGVGDQFGASVATDGTRVFAGAPAADLEGDNSGAVYGFAQGAEGWNPRRLEIEAAAGTQLGTSLALSGDLLVAGAPAPPPEVRAGGAHVFRLSGPSREILQPANAEIRDLTGFAVAVDGGRVVVGGVLGDQGDGSAGAVWSFRCSAEGCAAEAEAVARDDLKERFFGVSVALAGDSLAVGAPAGDETSTGAVYLYRPAGSGWRQEERLASIYPGDGFGTSVALDGSLLAIGAPGSRISPVSPPLSFPNGSVDLFVRRGSSWVFEATLAPPGFGVELVIEPVAFGASVAVSGETVAIGAPGHRAVYLFEKRGQVWTSTTLTFPDLGFGAAVSLRGDVLAIGAPGGNDGVGAAYVSVRKDQKWSAPLPLPVSGYAVSVGEGFLAVGAPGIHGGDGAVFVLREEGPSWGRPVQLSGAGAPRGFGFSMDLDGHRLAVGAWDPEGEGRAVLFDLESGERLELAAPEPRPGDGFGFAVALSESFLVVGSPGPARADRATVFALEGELP